MPVEWEYKRIIRRRYDEVEGFVIHEFNHLGAQGWELTLISEHFVYFKRSKTAPVGPATGATLKLQGGSPMPGQITVDTTNETVTLAFTDDHGDTDAAQPAGSVVSFTSDTPAVATVAPSATNPLVGDVTPVAEGTANIGATVVDANGATLFTVASVPVTVGAGPATGAALVLSV